MKTNNSVAVHSLFLFNSNTSNHSLEVLCNEQIVMSIRQSKAVAVADASIKGYSMDSR